jgi:putative phosphoribosyl transferase
LFKDRRHAGRMLADQLESAAAQPDLLVLGLPRGGVPVAAEVAERLGAPLDLWLVRKLGVPGHDELAMGAIASGGDPELDQELIRQLRIGADALASTLQRERAELLRQEQAYRRGQPPMDVRGRTVILVDDGMATGASMRAAVRALRCLGPARVVAAVPVASVESCRELGELADACVCVAQPQPFLAVGVWYEDFAPTSDAEVIACLERSSTKPFRAGAVSSRSQGHAAEAGGSP